MNKAIDRVCLCLLLILLPILSHSAPLPMKLVIHKQTEDCFAYLPGDEHFSASLSQPQDWHQFSANFDHKIITPFGVCDYGDEDINICCTQLGRKLLTNSEAQAFMNPILRHDPIPTALQTPPSQKTRQPESRPHTSVNSVETTPNLKFLFFIVGFILLGVLAHKLEQKIAEIKGPQISNYKFKKFVLMKIYPLICIGVGLYLGFNANFDKTASFGPLAAGFAAIFNAMFILGTSLLTITLALAFYLYNLTFLSAIIMIINLYFCINSIALIPYLYKLLN